MSESKLHYFHPAWIESTSDTVEADVCVYGGTAAGVVAAIKAIRRGRRAVIVHPGLYLGGMTTGGLGRTDSGQRETVGGMARQFYRDMGAHCGVDEQWDFEPSTAQHVLRRMLAEADVPVYRRQFLEAVRMEGKRIAEIRCLGGLAVRARMFVDATYEGDLLAKAGVSYTTGREANAVYGETLNGVQLRHYHQFSHHVDPYVVEGDPGSGLLPCIESVDEIVEGEGDHRIQAYCFRVCMTDDPGLIVPFAKPAGFDAREYVLATRWYRSEKDEYNEHIREGSVRKFDRVGVDLRKTDTNNHGPVSSDYIGANYGWPEGSYQEREAIYQRHVNYQQGFYWFMANDPSIPARYRELYASFGLAGDEFEQTGHWPAQLYVREARRMVSDYVVTEHDCMLRRACEDPVAMGSYTMDSHNCRRLVWKGRVLNEGDVQVRPSGPYGISYRSIIPRRGECENLVVPVCASTSHIAYGTLRMEPVFMMLGESAAIAMDLALDADSSLQDVSYDALGPELQAAGQVLTAPAASSL